MIDKKSTFYDANLQKRRIKSSLFRYLVLASVSIVILFLIFFIVDLSIKAFPALKQTKILVPVSFSQKTIKNPRSSIDRKMRRLISRKAIRSISAIVKNNPSFIDTKKDIWLIADDQVDQYLKHNSNKLKSKQKKIIDKMFLEKKIKTSFNVIFFINGDSKNPEQAGLFSATVGTILTMIITLIVAFPLGVATAIYLEEFTKDNKFTQFIEININNLAAIPSILFGILGLAIFINIFHMPRSSPLVGGLTLALMVLPIIVVSSRAAIKSVQVKLKQAGFGLGFSKWQVIRYIVLPNAMPGMLTGSIIALAQAIGETAPLIIIGMVVFSPMAPSSILDASTVMPAQIFTWASMPEIMYIEKTALGILVLLLVMVFLNSIAIWLRKKLQKEKI